MLFLMSTSSTNIGLVNNSILPFDFPSFKCLYQYELFYFGGKATRKSDTEDLDMDGDPFQGRMYDEGGGDSCPP